MLIGWYAYLFFLSLVFWDTILSSADYELKLDSIEQINRSLERLNNRCVESSIDSSLSNFAICFFRGIILNQFEDSTDSFLAEFPLRSNIWEYSFEESLALVSNLETSSSSPYTSFDRQVYLKEDKCEDENGFHNHSKILINIECCGRLSLDDNIGDITFLLPTSKTMSLSESSPLDSIIKFPSTTDTSPLVIKDVNHIGCITRIEICSPLVCKQPRKSLYEENIMDTPPPWYTDPIEPSSTTTTPTATTAASSPSNQSERSFLFHTRYPNKSFKYRKTPIYDKALTLEEQQQLILKVRDMFYHSYHSYLQHAFPKGELKPISCEGGHFDLIKIPLVTLIDTLDTLIVMNDFQEFRHAIKLVIEYLPNKFDFDVNISVFETTIRLLGGLLSAHLFAIDPTLAIYNYVSA
jgi:hypothetical protein